MNFNKKNGKLNRTSLCIFLSAISASLGSFTNSARDPRFGSNDADNQDRVPRTNRKYIAPNPAYDDNNDLDDEYPSAKQRKGPSDDFRDRKPRKPFSRDEEDETGDRDEKDKSSGDPFDLDSPRKKGRLQKRMRDDDFEDEEDRPRRRFHDHDEDTFAPLTKLSSKNTIAKFQKLVQSSRKDPAKLIDLQKLVFQCEFPSKASLDVKFDGDVYQFSVKFGKKSLNFSLAEDIIKQYLSILQRKGLSPAQALSTFFDFTYKSASEASSDRGPLSVSSFEDKLYSLLNDYLSRSNDQKQKSSDYDDSDGYDDFEDEQYDDEDDSYVENDFTDDSYDRPKKKNVRDDKNNSKTKLRLSDEDLNDLYGGRQLRKRIKNDEIILSYDRY